MPASAATRNGSSRIKLRRWQVADVLHIRQSTAVASSCASLIEMVGRTSLNSIPLQGFTFSTLPGEEEAALLLFDLTFFCCDCCCCSKCDLSFRVRKAEKASISLSPLLVDWLLVVLGASLESMRESRRRSNPVKGFSPLPPSRGEDCGLTEDSNDGRQLDSFSVFFTISSLELSALSKKFSLPSPDARDSLSSVFVIASAPAA
mmetsp:Transcript_734/g.1599  ORF Transcript_734/g.1599 Transcript_734/m.1599 type:complete len:204 (-) Transcript_734:15-626(-)